MTTRAHTHDIFLLLAQISQIRAPERIWEFFVSGMNFIDLGVEIERTDPLEADSERYLAVAFAGKLLGGLRYSGPKSDDPIVLETLQNAVSMLAAVLQARIASQALTQARIAKQASVAEPELRRKILETAPDIIYIYDLEEQRNIYVSRSIETALGYGPEELASKGAELFTSLIHPDDLSAVVANEERLAVAADGVVTEVSYRMRSAEGQWRWFHSRETCFSRHPDGRVARKIGLSVDVTERRVAEAAAHESSKLEAIGQLAGGVAHDFNNVLCAITGNAELMLLDLSSDDPSRESVEEILEASSRASELTTQLLAFARKQVIKPRVLDLNEHIRGMLETLSEVLGDEVALHVQTKVGLGQILSDPNHIDQLVLNLALNAHDAMPDGGDLSLSTAELELDEASAPEGLRPGHYVLLEIRDTGVGMSDDIRARIFEPFFTTKELGRSTGLGLATVFGIIKQHKGHIEVESEPGEGSMFRIYFPRAKSPAQSSAQSGASKLRGGDETVLVVEDESVVRKLACKLLASLGYEVLSASSGAEALAIHDAHEGTIDLLFTDVIMPEMNGREVADALLERQPDLHVLFSSGYSPGIIAGQGVLGEGTKFLPKPYSLQNLSTSVRELLDDRQARQSGVHEA